MNDSTYVTRQETWLEKAEALLYGCFFEQVKAGKWDDAREIIGLLEALFII